jgi:hypothetical protein
MVSANVCIWTLARAREVAGGERGLARWLQVPMRELQRWLGGKELPPTGVFLAAVDIVQQGDRRRTPRQLGEQQHL